MGGGEGHERGVAEAPTNAAGRALSLVPVIDQNDAWPTDLLAPAEPARPDADAHSRRCPPRRSTACRSTTAASGSPAGAPIASACSSRLSPKPARSISPAARPPDGARRLSAAHPLAGLRRGWDTALQLSVGRLSAIVFDRAINGRIEQMYQDGELVAERRVPSDKMLTWLLARLDPKRFALPWEQRGDADPQAEAVAAFPALLDAITDAVS